MIPIYSDPPPPQPLYLKSTPSSGQLPRVAVPKIEKISPGNSQLPCVAVPTKSKNAPLSGQLPRQNKDTPGRDQLPQVPPRGSPTFVSKFSRNPKQHPPVLLSLFDEAISIPHPLVPLPLTVSDGISPKQHPYIPIAVPLQDRKSVV